MSVLGSLSTWAKNVFNSIAGAIGNPVNALMGLWHYIAALHNVVAWLIRSPLLGWARALVKHLQLHHLANLAIRDALHRIPGWIWLALIAPTRDFLQHQISANLVRMLVLTTALRALALQLYQQSLAYTRLMVSIERVQRTEADHAEHVAMLAEVVAALATVQRQAATGYNSGLHDRLGIVAKLLEELRVEDPVIKAAVKDLITAVLDFYTIDDPVLRFVITKALTELAGRLGIDSVIGDLVNKLVDTLLGGGKPKGLQDVTRDVSHRLNDLESKWADFFANGGADVEQAGKEWHDLASLAVDAGIVAMFGLAVTEPRVWAATVSDTIGTVGNDTLSAVFNLLKHV